MKYIYKKDNFLYPFKFYSFIKFFILYSSFGSFNLYFFKNFFIPFKKMPLTLEKTLFFEKVIEFLNTLKSDEIRVFTGYSDKFLEWLKNQNSDNLKIVSDYKP